jgi:hypothetical protein
MVRTVALASLLLVCFAAGLCCAPGNRDWRRESYETTVALRGAGDERCSDPAPWTSLRACLNHDAAYELARRTRCAGGDSDYSSAQSRFVADATLLATLAADGYPEYIATGYYLAVRVGGWWPWRFGECP